MNCHWSEEIGTDKTCCICGRQAKEHLGLQVDVHRRFLPTAMLSYDCVCDECTMDIQSVVGKVIEKKVKDIRGEW